jgi:hypothetical protein
VVALHAMRLLIQDMRIPLDSKKTRSWLRQNGLSARRKIWTKTSRPRLRILGAENVTSASEHATSIREVFNDLVAWEGIVEVFDLIDHPKAKRCYAWSFEDGDKIRSVVVLELPPVDSPETAGKLAIAAKARELGEEAGNRTRPGMA